MTNKKIQGRTHQELAIMIYLDNSFICANTLIIFANKGTFSENFKKNAGKGVIKHKLYVPWRSSGTILIGGRACFLSLVLAERLKRLFLGKAITRAKLVGLTNNFDDTIFYRTSTIGPGRKQFVQV